MSAVSDFENQAAGQIVPRAGSPLRCRTILPASLVPT